MQHRFQNITCQAVLIVDLPSGTSTCPATLLNKGELHYEDSVQNITCRAWKVRVLIVLPILQVINKTASIRLLDTNQSQ